MEHNPMTSLSPRMHRAWITGLAAATFLVGGALVPEAAFAKRMGAGKSAGMQRNMPARTAPEAAHTAPTAAAQAPAATAQAAKPAVAPAAAPAAAPKRSWLGPLAGLAAGFGLAALMSHMGMGAEFGSLILMAVLAMAGFMVFRMLRSRVNGGATPAMAGAGAGLGVGSSSPGAVPTPWSAQATPLQKQSLELPSNASAPEAPVAARSTAPVAAAFVPAAFDSEGFARTAKAIFIRMQAANDTANLDDLRQFTTPDLFAQIKLDLLDRANATQQTDVQRLDTKVLDVMEEDGQSVVSVRYTGTAVEAAGQAPAAFDEVWHLVKAHGSERWLIAGIEQMA